MVVRHPIGPLIFPTFDLAAQCGRMVDDCLYLALAIQLGGRMVTADEKLVNALRGTPWQSHITTLQTFS